MTWYLHTGSQYENGWVWEFRPGFFDDMGEAHDWASRTRSYHDGDLFSLVKGEIKVEHHTY